MARSWNIILLGLIVLSSINTILGAEDNSTTTMPPTTTKPTTTSTEGTTKVTTTPMPTTSPPVTTTSAPHMDDMWVIKDPKTGRVCLVAKMKIQLDVPYTNTYTNKTIMKQIMVPGNASGMGSCDTSKPAKVQMLSLSWPSGNKSNTMDFTFFSNATSKQYWLGSIIAHIVADNMTFPNISITAADGITLANTTGKFFVTPMDNSYSCATNTNLRVSESPEAVNSTAFITFEHFQLEAFKNATNNEFSTAIYCDGDNTPDLVPVLVGATLVGLVVIVLGVYLWGRRRSQLGYLSM